MKLPSSRRLLQAVILVAAASLTVVYGASGTLVLKNTVTVGNAQSTDNTEMHPGLQGLVTRYYEPSAAEAARIDGMSRQAYETRAARATAHLEELRSTIDYDTLGVADQVDYEYFAAQLDHQVHRLAGLRWWERDPSQYLPFNEYYRPTTDHTLPWDARIERMIAGLDAAPVRFTWGRENLRDVPFPWLEQSIELCERILLYLDNWVPQVADRAASVELKGQLLEAVARFRPHVEDFRDFLDNDLRAGATDAVRLPAEDYERLLANNFLDYSLEELLEIGRRVHEETRQNLDETARMIDPTKSWLQLHQDNSLDFPAPWELHSYLQSQADRARELVYSQVVDVPEDMREEFRYIEAGHYRNLFRMGFGVGSNRVKDGTFFGYYDLPTTAQFHAWEGKTDLMLDWSRGWAVAQQIPHEIYPGHHFQGFMASRVERPLRRYARNSVFGEGWGVYCEDLMYELGYLQDNPRYLLAHYQNRFWRTARIIVDVSFHSGRMDEQEIIDFFMDAGLPRAGAEFEAMVVSKSPTRELSYYIGKLEIEKLVQDYKELAGDSFNRKAFFTRLLLLGGTPPKLARRELFADAN